MNMVHCEILCLSAMVTCKDVFLLFSMFPSVINGCTTLNGNQEGCTGEIYNTGLYTVNENAPSIVLVLRCWVTGNKEPVQTTCSTSRCSQSLLPHMLFWKNFRYFCFCLVFPLVLLLVLLISLILPVPWTSFRESQIKDWNGWKKCLCFSVTWFYSNNSFLFVYECNSERQWSNTHF